MGPGLVAPNGLCWAPTCPATTSPCHRYYASRDTWGRWSPESLNGTVESAGLSPEDISPGLHFATLRRKVKSMGQDPPCGILPFGQFLPCAPWALLGALIVMVSRAEGPSLTPCSELLLGLSVSQKTLGNLARVTSQYFCDPWWDRSAPWRKQVACHGPVRVLYFSLWAAGPRRVSPRGPGRVHLLA